jgi:hypothetical protein
VWTDNRVEAWRTTGERHSVGLWTTRQLATFLDVVAEDRLFAMWWLIALRGARRGEAAGLRWVGVDPDQKVVMIDQQRIAFGETVTVGPPKTAASRRTIALDGITVHHLREHLSRQRAERGAAGETWHDSGYVFTAEDGAPLHRDWLTRRFKGLVKLSGLPPVRLHDLRHGAATLAHSAGARWPGTSSRTSNACRSATAPSTSSPRSNPYSMPPTSAARTLDLADADAARGALLDAGFASVAMADIAFDVDFESEDDAVAVQLPAGPVAAAVRQSGRVAVEAALRSFFAPRLRADGTVRMGVVFRCYLAEPAR